MVLMPMVLNVPDVVRSILLKHVDIAQVKGCGPTAFLLIAQNAEINPCRIKQPGNVSDIFGDARVVGIGAAGVKQHPCFFLALGEILDFKVKPAGPVAAPRAGLAPGIVIGVEVLDYGALCGQRSRRLPRPPWNASSG